jgi:hypothetical protein
VWLIFKIGQNNGIKMKNKSMQSFESECGKAKVFVENDMPIGVFHDFLMEMKGLMVDRMVAAHKEQQALADAQREESEKQEACAGYECTSGDE